MPARMSGRRLRRPIMSHAPVGVRQAWLTGRVRPSPRVGEMAVAGRGLRPATAARSLLPADRLAVLAEVRGGAVDAVHRRVAGGHPLGRRLDAGLPPEEDRLVAAEDVVVSG